MFDVTTLATIGATFLLAGIVKGVIGLGLPTVSLAILAISIGLTDAMVLLLVPSFVTNLWQAMVGGHGALLLRRLWPFLLLAGATIWVGALALRTVELSLLSVLLGALLVIYALVSLAGLRLSIPAAHERWAGPLIGSINGLLTGMTGSFVVPGVMFLQAIGLPRDQLVQAMGILFTISTLALALALGGNHFLTTNLGVLSVGAIVPAIAGMKLGQVIRSKISESRFRQVFFISVLVLGLYMIANSLYR